MKEAEQEGQGEREGERERTNARRGGRGKSEEGLDSTDEIGERSRLIFFSLDTSRDGERDRIVADGSRESGASHATHTYTRESCLRERKRVACRLESVPKKEKIKKKDRR